MYNVNVSIISPSVTCLISCICVVDVAYFFIAVARLDVIQRMQTELNCFFRFYICL